MKKSLLAVAAMTAFAGAAQAQSSVTVYGILDVGYIGGNSRVSSSAITNNGGQAKQTVNQFGQSAETTSRLGFKGTEDLGGGMSAFFTAEFQLYPQDNSLSGQSATTGASSGLLNRQTFVGLSKKGLGQSAIGTQYTPVFNASAKTSPGQHNNMIGDVVYAGAAIVGLQNANNGATVASFTNRTSNTLTIASDKFAGFGVNAMYTLNNQNDSQTSATGGGNSNASGWGLGADYTFKKFYATAAYQALKQYTTGGTTNQVWGQAQANGATVAPAGAGAALNVQDNQFFAGATYDFGILKAYAQYVNRKATATNDSSTYLSRSAQQIGVRSFITPKVEGWASAGTGRYRLMGNNEPTANFNGWQLGSNYWLSKRTNLYAIYGQTIFSQAASNMYTGSASASNYAVGVRHTF